MACGNVVDISSHARDIDDSVPNVIDHNHPVVVLM
jgi:hypothetical protein